MPTTLEDLMKRSVKSGDCLLCAVNAVRDGKTMTTTVRKVWELVHGSKPERAFVRRTCKREECINPDHLFLQEWDKPKSPKQERTGLVAGQVQSIRRMHAEGTSVLELSKMFEIRIALVWKIIHRQIWKMLP